MRKKLRAAAMCLCLGACVFLASGTVSYAKQDAEKELAKQQKELEKQEKHEMDKDFVGGPGFDVNPEDMYILVKPTPPIPKPEVPTFDAIKDYVDSRVYASFVRLEFSYVIDRSMTANGVFSVRDHWIKVRDTKRAYVLHELGHFVSSLKAAADSTTEFKAIYQLEKSKYVGSNKPYMTQNCYEYFAESFRNYSEDPTTLKTQRPKTYEYINRVVKSINVEIDTAKYRQVYGPMWR